MASDLSGAWGYASWPRDAGSLTANSHFGRIRPQEVYSIGDGAKSALRAKACCAKQQLGNILRHEHRPNDAAV